MNGSSQYIGVLKGVKREFWNLITSAEAAKEARKTQVSLSFSMES